MASPNNKKGQRRGSCGHVMASFDSHDKCARCRDKLIGEDDCVLKKSCAICEGFSDSQRELLATPTYRIRKDKKADLLVSPKDVTVLTSVDDEPTFQSPSGASAQASAEPISAPPSTMASSSSTSQATGYVTSDQFLVMSDKWPEQFARMEALLSRGNIFSTPVSAVKPIDTQPLVSKTPFVPPATRSTGPVEVPVAVEAQSKHKHTDDKDKKKKTHKSRKQERSMDDDPKPDKKTVQKHDTKVEKKRDRSVSLVRQHASTTKQGHSISPPADPSSGLESAKQLSSKGGSSSLFSSGPNVTTGHTGQPSSTPAHRSWTTFYRCMCFSTGYRRPPI